MKKLLIGLIAVTALTADASESYDYTQPIRSINWSDGDSGSISYYDGHVIQFTLANLDAPEIGGVGTAIDSAKCEKERELGFETKEFIVNYTRGKKVLVTNHHGQDRYDRHIVDLSVDKESLFYIGMHSGALRPWSHENGKTLEPKPDWCS